MPDQSTAPADAAAHNATCVVVENTPADCDEPEDEGDAPADPRS